MTMMTTHSRARARRLPAAVLALLFLIVLAAGCGGGGSNGGGDGSGGGTTRRTGSLTDSDPQFEDGSFFDEWTFEAAGDGTVTIEMTSNDVNTYLIVVASDGATTIAEDSSRVSFEAAQGDQFTVLATTVQPETGSYALVFDGVTNISAGRATHPGRSFAGVIKKSAPRAKR